MRRLIRVSLPFPLLTISCQFLWGRDIWQVFEELSLNHNRNCVAERKKQKRKKSISKCERDGLFESENEKNR